MARLRAKPWDWVLIVLLVGSVALVFWYDSSENEGLRFILEWVDLALVAFFVGEWLWRVSHAPRPGRAALRSSWELLGMVPLMAPLPAFLRALRLFRLVRILRVFGQLGKSIGVWERIAHESQLGRIALASGSITVGGALLVWALEKDVNERLVDLSEAFWWAIVTVTTVGYGDITPMTPMGRFVAAVLMVTGIGTIGLLASSVASVLVTKRQGEAAAAEAVGRQAGTGAAAGRGTVAPLGPAAGSLASQLATLADLHERGHLNKAEFEAAKARVLGQVP